MSSSGLSVSYRQALSGIHAFSGNDYVSSFFRKGKQLFWKKLLEYPDFVDVFSKLGVFNAVTPDRKVCLHIIWVSKAFVSQQGSNCNVHAEIPEGS